MERYSYTGSHFIPGRRNGKLRLKEKLLALLLTLAMIITTLPNAAIVSAQVNGDLTKLSYEAATEGMVLLKNDNNVLPLQEDSSISIFGRTQIDIVKGGSGSSNVGYAAVKPNILDAFRESAIPVEIDETLAAVYEKWCEDNPPPRLDRDSLGNTGAVKIFPEMPLPAGTAAAAGAKSDTAVVVLGRMSGEGFTPATGVTGDLKAVPGEYFLSPEEVTMLTDVNAAFDKIVVVVNTCSIIDMSWIETYDKIDSVLLAWAPGGVGGTPIVDLLTGKVNPSGKLTDTIAYEHTDYPSDDTFGDNSPVYTEDVYVGYRYFETFAPGKVRYEFGYGLSYTTFTQELVAGSFSANDQTISLKVKVTNTGTVAGKEVVQFISVRPKAI